jgi:hypothetical protein
VHWTDPGACALSAEAEAELTALGLTGLSFEQAVDIIATLQGQRDELRTFFGG